ncbi:MAG: choice-of-anchor Q domain-containing protein [Anaerolineaceae bacterium]|nr:choice-of-anchor Q domain-containing protein [Anaerolineaceae bacterium]
MKSKSYLRALNIFAILVFLVSEVGIQPGQAAAMPLNNPPSVKIALNASPTPPAGKLRYGYNANTGKLSFVGGDLSAPLQAASAGGVSAQGLENASAMVFSKYANDFGLKDPSKELKLERTEPSNSGDTLRYQQQYNGIPVVGGEQIINSDAKGNIISLNGKVSPQLSLASTTPAISATQAVQAALAGMQTWYKIDPSKASPSQPALWIYDERIFKPSQLPVVLTWRMDVKADSSNGPVDELVLVNAQTGQIALHFNQVDTLIAQRLQDPDATPSATSEPPTQEPTAAATEPSATTLPTETSTAAPSATASPLPTQAPTDTAAPGVTPVQQPSQTAIPTSAPTATLPPSPTPTSSSIIKAQTVATWYVSTSGNDGNDCATPTSPCATINGALGKAAAGDTIEIGTGTYTGSGSEVVNVTQSVTLSGGWNATFSSQNGFSTIDGKNARAGIGATEITGFNITIVRFILTNCLDSSSDGKGSALYVSDQNLGNTTDSLTIEDSSFNHNNSSKGSTVSVIGVHNLTIFNTTIGENVAGAAGGLYLEIVKQGLLNNMTIVNNHSTGLNGAGGLVVGGFSGDQVTLDNSIIINNINDAQEIGNDDCDNEIGLVSGGYNLIRSCYGTLGPGDIQYQDPKLGAILALGYYPLLQNSPAIDHGNPAAPGSGGNACAATDQLGTTRPIDGDKDKVAVCDIGAYETTPPAPSVPYTITVSKGNSQARALNHPYDSFSVVVKDQYGALLQGATVTFTAPSSGASGTFADTATNKTTATTNYYGVATPASFTANSTAGQYVLQASVTGVASPAQFQLQNYVQAVSTISLSAGNNQFASHLRPFATNLQVYIKDTYGNPMDGATVSFSAPASGASGIFADSKSPATTAVSDANGIASAAVFTANTSMGSYIVRATLTGLSQEIDFNLTNKDMYVSPDGVNPNSSTGTECADPASPCQTITYAASKASPGVTLFLRSGLYLESMITISQPNLLSISGGWNEDYSAQTAPSILEGQSPGFDVPQNSSLGISNLTIGYGRISVENGGTLSVQNSAIVYLRDYGAIYNHGTSTIINTTINGTGGTSWPSDAYGIDNTGHVTLENDTITGIDGTAIYDEEMGVASVQNSILANNLYDCGFYGGYTTSNGYNIFGSNSTNCPTSNKTDLFNIDPKLSGLINQSYQALLPGSPAIDAISNSDPNAVCPATDQRGVTRPVNNKCDIGAYEYIPAGISTANNIALVNGSLQTRALQHSYAPLFVIVKDQFGAPLQNATVTFSAPSSGASGTFADTSTNQTTSVTDANGIATSAVLTANAIAGKCTVIASVSGVANQVAFQLDNYVQAPASITIVAGNNQEAVLTKAFQTALQVYVEDTYGHAMDGATVTFNAPSSGASGSFADSGNATTTAITNSQGIATAAIFSANGSNGQYTVEASVPGLATKADFQLENYILVPAKLVVSSGNNQYSSPLKPFLTALQAYAEDTHGHPIVGTTVTFIAPSSGASGTFADSSSSTTTAVTDANGIAMAAKFTANSIRGSYIVTASIDELSQQATFSLANRDLYVGTNGSDYNPANNNCSDPAHPCQTLSNAISQAKAGITIYIASGNYTQGNITISLQNLNLSGGWDSTFSTQNGQSEFTGKMSYGLEVSTTGSSVVDHIDVNQNNYNLQNQGTLEYQNGAIKDGAFADILNQGNLTLINATITNATSIGLDNKSGTSSLTNVTVAQNMQFNSYSGAHLGNGIQNEIGTVTLKNTIVALNRSFGSYDCSGNITSLGHNLIGVVDGCTFTSATGDKVGTANKPLDPGLGPLDYIDGSQTETIPLLPYSPAIDAADPNGCPATDQRGVARPIGNGCDIGAFEGVEQENPEPVLLTFNDNERSGLPGNLVCEEPGGSCQGIPPADVLSAEGYSRAILNFYLSHFRRNSLDNGGMPVLSTVYSTNSPNNSFWNGYEVVYADGYPQADDVVMHELTHGVTQYEANLFDYYQSGSINESISDIFGEYFHQTNNPTDTTFLVGEKLPGGAVRSMKDPTLFKDPDKMTSTYYYQGPNDSGGVHINSGVNNKAAYLMVAGGTFNGKTVAPLGRTKTGDIYYYTLTHLLTSGSDYADLYNDLYQACTVLNGTDDITAADCQQVRNATDAVQMNLSPSSTYNPDTSATCPSGTSKDPNNLFFDNMENGSANWTFGAFQGNPHWGIDTGYAASGDYALYGDDTDATKASTDQVSDSYAAMNNGIAVPTGHKTYLFFNHAFGFSYGVNGTTTYYLDGGVLEYTTDNGETWHDAKPLFDAGENYNGTLYNGTYTGYNPLRNRAAFVGESHGYVSSRYNLTSLAGKTVNFRWRLGTDYEYSYLGWLVDDVTIYQCIGNPAVPVLSAPANGGLVYISQPKLDWGDAANASSYQLEVAADSGFTNLVMPQQNLPGSSSQYSFTSELPANTRYYWHVRTLNSLNIQSAWSSTWSFRTALVTPALSSPANGSIVNNLRPPFTWSTSPGATSYTLVVSANSSFSSPLLNLTFLPAVTGYIPTKDLPSGKKLYARVMANGANPSAWSSITFTTPVPPNVPVLVSPANNAVLANITPGSYQPTLSWNPVTVPTGAFAFSHYELQVSDQADFSSLLYPDDTYHTDNLTAASFQIPVFLPDNHQYFWRVRAYNTNGDFSSWAAFSFHTAIVKPVPGAPDNGSTLHNLRPSFDWSTPDGATSYTLQVSSHANLTSPVLNVTVSSLPYTPAADLPAGEPLYWHVHANGPNGPSLWSDTWSFTTPKPPSVPVLVSPGKNALLTNPANQSSFTPTLSWKAVTVPVGAPPFDHYELQVSDTSDFSHMLYPSDPATPITLTTTSFQIPNPLSDNQQIYWRVRAWNNNKDVSSWAVFSFRTAIVAPVPSYPLNNSVTPITTYVHNSNGLLQPAPALIPL